MVIFGMAEQLAMNLLKESMIHYRNCCKPSKSYSKSYFIFTYYSLKLYEASLGVPKYALDRSAHLASPLALTFEVGEFA